jgi:hypothetical protein
MPSFHFRSANLVAGTVYTPLVGWQYEYVPFAAHVKIIVNAAQTVLSDIVNLSITSGSEQIQESSPISSTAFANAGTYPAELNFPAITWLSPAGDRLKLVFTSTTAGPNIVQGTIYINPLRGR